MTYKKWNWQKKEWLDFYYNSEEIESLERDFFRQSGISIGVTKHLLDEDHQELVIELVSNEALKTSEIEGEILDRDSLQSSLRKEFGLNLKYHFEAKSAEAGIAEMMKDLYINYDSPLSKEILCEWHDMLMNGRRNIEAGKYRTHKEVMQIVSGRYDKPKVHFEVPPSPDVPDEMEKFIKWFNDTGPGGKNLFHH